MEKEEKKEEPKRRRWFNQGNIRWVHFSKEDETIIDSRGNEIKIKRYKPFNRGWDYRESRFIKEQPQIKAPEGDFTFDTAQGNTADS